ncbi:UBA/THIF-type NAD/FAD binding fold protein [Actinoplanes capillaceus]|uniref:UBA/THIF-type NAD/FAD binding fold protein n=1 Tax=Actinoplanes campanulatus TaxID=113559 RepID=A0ABQ3WTN1_9ACTN|nr:ThiF family adenylyltransferase [Actinoplanes capillaceus]GID49515.1 UBA/THIF-type NAD/FAD binding fold protein [Actinoplanes capillaceus]
MTKRKRNQLTDWQTTATRELRAVAATLPNDFELVGRPRLTGPGLVQARIRLRTGDLPRAPRGLPLLQREEFLLWIGPNRLLPPFVEVEHGRFLGYPHVLLGQYLCIYLDPAREWNPQRGFASAIDRLHEWLADAAAARFDPDAALYHAIGGIPHRTLSSPTIVIRESGKPIKAQPAYLTVRSKHRSDLHYGRSHPGQHQAVVFQVASPLPLGAGTRLLQLLAILDTAIAPQAFGTPTALPQAAAFLTALAAAASRNPMGVSQTFILAIPHPSGGPPHLLAGQVPARTADELRRRVRSRPDAVITINAQTLDNRTPVEWYAVSDERESVTTRRDTNRPTNAYLGRTIQIWGCGGLGSWIAEFIARAGAKRLILCDPGTVTGGLLVRQDFTEDDIGKTKAEALLQRLAAIRDDIAVEAHTSHVPENLATLQAATDLIIDATVSRAIGQLLDELAPSAGRPLLAQVATDAGTSTLGLLTVSALTNPSGPNNIDQQAGKVVTADGGLEPFHAFWKNVSTEDELIPTRGCSVPTFHGSAADMAAVAASLTSMLGTHLACTEPISGSYLIGLPHSPAGPFRRFIPAA